MHPNFVSYGETMTWSMEPRRLQMSTIFCKCPQMSANVCNMAVDGTLAQRCVVLSCNIICSCHTLSYEVPQVNLPPAPPFFVFPVPFLDCDDLQTYAWHV